MFTLENTTGYTTDELITLNAQWVEIVERDELEPGSDEYHAAEKAFADLVAGR